VRPSHGRSHRFKSCCAHHQLQEFAITLRSAIGFCIASLTLACGARSGLLDPTSTGGTAGSSPSIGGSGGSALGGSGGALGGSGGIATGGGGLGGFAGTSGTGGSGGTGGTVVPDCRGPLLEGIADITGVNAHDEMDPAMTISSDDGSKVTLMFRWQALEPIDPIGIPPAKLGHLDFDAWQPTWPENLGQTWVAESYGSGSSFALGGGPGDFHSFLYFDDGFTSEFVGMAFAAAAIPKSGPPPLKQIDDLDARALFVSEGIADHLIGWEKETDPGTNRFTYGRVQGGKFFGWADSGCSKTRPISASAVRVPNAYLMALTSESPFGWQCSPGPTPFEMQLVRSGDSLWPELVWATGQNIATRQVLLVRGTNRIWFLSQDDSAAAEIRAITLDLDGNPIASLGPLVQSGMTNGPFAATTVGSRLVLAYPSSSGTEIVVDVFTETGTKIFDTVTGVSSPPPYGILGAPGGNRLLVSWAAPNAAGEKRVQVARFCLPPE
jgi:hypothetical protein